MKYFIASVAVALVAGVLYLGPRTNICVATQLDHEDRFYCTKGPGFGPDHDQRMRWAADIVANQLDFYKLKLGVYDWCLDKSLLVKTVGPVYDQHSAYRSSGLMGNIQPVGLSDDFTPLVQDACALIMIGGEW